MINVILKKVVPYIILLLFPVYLQGQFSMHHDTVLIKEVIIRSRPGDSLSSGFKTTTIDSSLLKYCANKTIAEVLGENSSVFIKNYGAGGIATTSFRGTGAEHTQVEWNNININNPMTAQLDLSLIPAGLIDRVEIFYGGSSMSLNSGGIGGIINIESKPDWHKRFNILISPEAGSFERYSGLLKLNAGSAGFQSVTKVFLLTCENNFPFTNTIISSEPVREIRENDQVRQNGYLQEFYYKLAKGVLSAKLWYQSAFRDLPEPIISLPSSSGEKQKDRSFRSIISFESCSGGRRFEINAAMVYDYLNYINRLASIDSKNSSNSFFLTGTMETKIGTRTNLKADFKDELNIINSNNFSGQKTRNLVSTGAVAETVFSDRLQTRILVRESLQDSKFPFPDFSAGAQLRIFPERKYFISANFSRNSRIPSLNEMYWAPGGNPDLKNETGYLSEISVSADQRLSSEINIKSGITLFHNIICDMIEWRPGEFAYWEAENIGKTTTSGMETSVSLRYFTSGLNILLNTGYTLTIAENNSGKQLIYVPVNRINGAVRIEGKHFYSGIITDFTGRRFLDADNSSYLPPYFVNNLEMGTMLKIKDNPCSLSFTINNIFNVSYQNIAWYPMPGRALLVSAVFQFK